MAPYPVRLESESLGFLVRQTHRALARGLAERLTAHDLSLSQWTTLRALWHEDGCSQVDLAQRIGVEKASLTMVFEALDNKGLIRRERSTEDKRRWHVYLTEAGRRLEKQLLPLAAEVERQALRNMSSSDAAYLRALLVKIIENMQEPAA